MKIFSALRKFLLPSPYLFFIPEIFIIICGVSFFAAPVSAGPAFVGPAFADSGQDIVFVQIADDFVRKPESQPVSKYFAKSRIVRFSTTHNKSQPELLTKGFFSACDPSVSFDGNTILFSGKRNQSDFWQIYRMNADGSNVHQITHDKHDNISPLHIGTLFYLNDSAPVAQIAYVGMSKDSNTVYSFFASNTDGTNCREITFNIFSDTEPDVLPNGRLVFSSIKPVDGNLKVLRKRIMAVNIDGTDLMHFTGNQAPLYHQKMARSVNDRVFFIESVSPLDFDGGRLISVSMFRSLHTRKAHTDFEDGSYHSPCPETENSLLVSYKKNDMNALYSLYRFNLESGNREELIYQSDKYHIVDTHILTSRNPVRGRSSVVGFRHKDSGVFFCMDVYESDRPEVKKLLPGSVKHVLVTEGIPSDASCTYDERVLGKATVEKDGSFHIRIPSETPVTFRLLDHQGKTLARQASWTWVMHGESRACIGCHEDRELSPPNRLIKSVLRKPDLLTPPVDKRTPYPDHETNPKGVE